MLSGHLREADVIFADDHRCGPDMVETAADHSPSQLSVGLIFTSLMCILLVYLLVCLTLFSLKVIN